MAVKMRFASTASALMLLAGGSAACGSATAETVPPGSATVHITIHFSRFNPDSVVVRPGETVRFVVRNTDPIDHEFILGDEAVQELHEQGTEAHHDPKPGEMSIPAGTTRVTRYTFPSTQGSLIFGCHLPGHYAYGMHGVVSIR